MSACCNGGCVQAALAQRLIDNTNELLDKVKTTHSSGTYYGAVLHAVNKLSTDFPTCIQSDRKLRDSCKALCERIYKTFNITPGKFPIPGSLCCEVSYLNLLASSEVTMQNA